MNLDPVVGEAGLRIAALDLHAADQVLEHVLLDLERKLQLIRKILGGKSKHQFKYECIFLIFKIFSSKKLAFLT
jgi:hypothetical protein